MNGALVSTQCPALKDPLYRWHRPQAGLELGGEGGRRGEVRGFLVEVPLPMLLPDCYQLGPSPASAVSMETDILSADQAPAARRREQSWPESLALLSFCIFASAGFYGMHWGFVLSVCLFFFSFVLFLRRSRTLTPGWSAVAQSRLTATSASLFK